MPIFCKDCRHYIGPMVPQVGIIELCDACPLKPVYDYVYGTRLNREFGEARNQNKGDCKLFEPR